MKLLKLRFDQTERAAELRSLWLRLGEGYCRRQLEELWAAEMEGRWTADFGESARVDPSIASLQRITDQIKKPDNPGEVRKEALERVMRRPARQVVELIAEDNTKAEGAS